MNFLKKENGWITYLIDLQLVVIVPITLLCFIVMFFVINPIDTIMVFVTGCLAFLISREGKQE